MSVLKRHPDVDYSTIPNGAITDTRLSPIEFRLYCYLRSKPNNWRVNNTDIMNRLLIKTPQSLANYWKTLLRLNIMARYPIREKGKFKGYDYELLPYVGQPQSVESNVEQNHNGENHIHSNTDLFSNTDKSNNKEKGEKQFSPEVQYCYTKCLSFFDQHLRPSDDPKDAKKVRAWMDTIDKLIRIEKLNVDVILSVVSWARKHEFWSGQFLSLTKLRKKNKDGVMYIVVFAEQMKSKRRSKTGPDSDADALEYLKM